MGQPKRTSAAETNIHGDSSRQHSSHSLDALIAQLAAAQHGVVARRQLIDLGLAAWEIDYRLRIGRLHLIHRGVYAVGHRKLTREGHWTAAVLAVGDDAHLSHRAAGALWGLLHPAQPRIDVTAPRRVHGPDGVTAHHRLLPADEITSERGIPVTSVPRTLLDLATVLTTRQVERAMEEAEARRLYDQLSLRDLVERYPGERGTGVVRAILDLDRFGATYTRSKLEEAFLAFVRARSLPSPELNVDLQLRPGRWIQADCVWRRRRVIVELDGRRFHGSPQAFERDRERDRALAVAGWTVIRVTWRQLREEPDRVASDLRALLERAGRAA